MRPVGRQVGQLTTAFHRVPCRHSAIEKAERFDTADLKEANVLMAELSE